MFRSMEPPDCYTLRSAGLTLTLFSLKALGRLEAWRLRSLKAWRLEGLETWRLGGQCAICYHFWGFGELWGWIFIDFSKYTSDFSKYTSRALEVYLLKSEVYLLKWSLGGLLGGLLGSVGRSWDLLGFLGAVLGASWGCLGKLLGVSGELLGASWGCLGASLRDFFSFVGCLGGDIAFVVSF